MQFHQLRYFVVAAEELNISRAALRLHLSQPALSRQIAVLEDELGVPLFDRIRRRIHLTECGRFFLPKARQLLCDAETCVQQVREEFGGERRTMRVGFITPFLDDLVAPAVREFRQRHPKTRISLFDLAPREQLERLRKLELDVAILGNIEDHERAEFVIRRLSRHRMALVLPDGHRLAGRKAVKLAALAGEPWVSLSDAAFPGRREFLRGICGRAGFAPRIAVEVDSLPMMLGAVAAGDGVALIPAHARKLPHAGCVFGALAAPVPVTELLLVMARRPAAADLQALVQLFADHATGLTED